MHDDPLMPANDGAEPNLRRARQDSNLRPLAPEASGRTRLIRLYTDVCALIRFLRDWKDRWQSGRKWADERANEPAALVMRFCNACRGPVWPDGALCTYGCDRVQEVGTYEVRYAPVSEPGLLDWYEWFIETVVNWRRRGA